MKLMNPSWAVVLGLHLAGAGFILASDQTDPPDAKSNAAATATANSTTTTTTTTTTPGTATATATATATGSGSSTATATASSKATTTAAAPTVTRSRKSAISPKPKTTAAPVKSFVKPQSSIEIDALRKYADSMAQRGRYNLRNGQPEIAVHNFLKAVAIRTEIHSLEKSDQEAMDRDRVDASTAYIDLNDFNTAKAKLKEVSDFENTPGALRNHGFILAHERNFGAAMEALSKSLALSPNDPSAYRLRAQLWPWSQAKKKDADLKEAEKLERRSGNATHKSIPNDAAVPTHKTTTVDTPLLPPLPPAAPPPPETSSSTTSPTEDARLKCPCNSATPPRHATVKVDEYTTYQVAIKPLSQVHNCRTKNEILQHCKACAK